MRILKASDGDEGRNFARVFACFVVFPRVFGGQNAPFFSILCRPFSSFLLFLGQMGQVFLPHAGDYTPLKNKKEAPSFPGAKEGFLRYW